MLPQEHKLLWLCNDPRKIKMKAKKNFIEVSRNFFFLNQTYKSLTQAHMLQMCTLQDPECMNTNYETMKL